MKAMMVQVTGMTMMTNAPGLPPAPDAVLRRERSGEARAAATLIVRAGRVEMPTFGSGTVASMGRVLRNGDR